MTKWNVHESCATLSGPVHATAKNTDGECATSTDYDRGDSNGNAKKARDPQQQQQQHQNLNNAASGRVLRHARSSHAQQVVNEEYVDIARRFALEWTHACGWAGRRQHSSLTRLVVALMVQLTSLHAAQLVREGDTRSVAPSAAPPARTPSHAGTSVVLHRASLGPRLHFHCRTCNVNILSSRKIACHITGQPDASMADLPASHLTVCSGATVRTWSNLVGARSSENADKEDNQQRRSGTSKYFGDFMTASNCAPRWRVLLRVRKRSVYEGTYGNEKEAALAYDRVVTMRGLVDKRLNRASFPDDFSEKANNKEDSADCAQHSKRPKAFAEVCLGDINKANEDSGYSTR
eukprot:jgi/Chlat1/5006/Chrsp32S04979